VTLLAAGILLALFTLTSGNSPVTAQSSPERPAALAVTAVSPSTAPNDLDTPLVITGTGFLDGAVVRVGEWALRDVLWVDATRLEGILPWGAAPGVYALTVTNPGGASANLPAALTVTRGLGTWTRAAGPEGGTIIQVLANPVTPTLLLALSDDDGLFRSLDGGASWELATGELAYYSMIALGADAHTVYAAAWGQLWRSDDNGTAWQELPIAGADEGVNRVYPHPTLADTVWAIVGWDTPQLFRSTDRGANWVEVTAGITDAAVTALGMDPGDPLRMALGTANGNIFLSADGGESWSFASHALTETIGSLAYHPSGSGEVWVTGSCRVAKSSNPALIGWIEVTEDMFCLIDDPTPLDFAPIAWGEAYSRTVLLVGTWPQVTYDGGATWSNYGPWWGTQALDLVPHPTIPGTAYVGCQQQGVQVTADGGSTWQVLPHGLTGIVPDEFAILPDDPGTAYALESSAVGLYKLEQGGAAWRYLPLYPTIPYGQGSAGAVALDPFQEGRLYLAVTPWWIGADIFVSLDGGESWPITATLPIPPDYCYYETQSLEPDPFSPGILVAGVTSFCDMGNVVVGGLYLSADYGENWIHLMPSQPISGVNDLAWDGGVPGMAYAATRGGLLRSTNGGLTWSPANNGLEPGAYSQVEIEPAPPYRVAVLGDSGLYISEDQGDTWLRRGSAPPGWNDIAALQFAPGDPPLLYSVSGLGLYASADGGVSWGRIPVPVGMGSIRSLASGGAASRTVIYAGASSGVYRFGSVPVTVTGRVTDAQTGLPLPGARIAAETGQWASAGEDGAYTLTLASGLYALTVSAEGYWEMAVDQDLMAGELVRDFALDPAPPLPMWTQANQPGFGSLDYGVSVLETFQPAGLPVYLYAGAWGQTDTKMWRTADGRTWEVAGTEWISPTTAMYDAQVFEGQLYVGVGSPSQLWRTASASWQAVDLVGFGDAHNLWLDALAVHAGALYAAVLNDATGTEIWRSASGNPGTWVQVNADGFGGPGTGTWGGDVVMDTFQGYLYVGLSRDGVGELWRTPDGTTWAAVFTDGLGNPNNGRLGMAEFNGELYISLRNVWQGGEVWRSGDGLSWEPVFTGGLGEVANGRPYGLLVADGALYVIFSNTETGAQVWRTFDGQRWQRCNVDGWDDPANTYADYNDKGAAVFHHNLYVGTLANAAGGEVWRAQLAAQLFLPLVTR
jgi:hypothetical protein